MSILSFEKTNEKCGDNLHGEAFVRICFEDSIQKISIIEML